MDVNELGFSLDIFCLRKDYNNSARAFFDIFDKPFKRLLTLENLLSQIEGMNSHQNGNLMNLVKKVFYLMDRESKGYITYWDVFQGYNLFIFKEFKI